jgi:hypothetical protein
MTPRPEKAAAFFLHEAVSGYAAQWRGLTIGSELERPPSTAMA